MKRLTVPEEMDFARRLYPTGNHFVSLPVVEAADASVDRVGVLHMGAAGLVEFGGPQAELGAETLPALEPLIRPFILIGGRTSGPGRGATASPSWRRLWDWVPAFEWRDEPSGLVLKGTLLAPVWAAREGLQSHKGFVYVLEVSGPAAGGAPPEDLRLGLTLTWGDLLETVYTSRRLPAALSVRRDRWTGGPVLEPRAGSGAGPAALAVSFSVPGEDVEWTARTDEAGVIRVEMTARPRGGAAAFYFGLNREGDGARTVAVDLARHGWESLLRATGAALAPLRRPVAGEDRLGAAGEESRVLGGRLNLNLLFNYFFAAGRTIDTEELVLVTSRSPLYYVSAAFWARDALLWSLPGLLLVDPGLAEEALGEAFGRYFRHAGIHSLYMDGTLLYPGFELDELAAYPIALWRYVRSTGDVAILGRRGLGPKLRRILDLMEEQAHPDPNIHLYRTFLLPSDDPATHPYVTYDNVMAWRALLCAADLLEWAEGRDGAELRDRAERVRASVYRHLVVDGPGGPVFAWSADLEGGVELGDEPPGSLELLPYYGFCSREDEVWRRTVGWIHSRENPYRYLDVPFPGVGCPHSPHPFVMSLFNALLGGLPERIAEARSVLLKAPLDTGLACEAFDRRTGEVKTGAAFATCAGFLAYAMHRVFGRPAHGEYRNGPGFVE